ncbi:hypothetical protein QBC36DRAFT_314629 [Triangularia setosa]|uniref:DUF7730 domain-containing protein n=1 Tax=Triangularia setosa TaxID=2587417 RepID=A0AAN6W1Q4_9PEZI|nr:hypothetical protein QBC36DRAFT_314629 [Podospora setosa]
MNMPFGTSRDPKILDANPKSCLYHIIQPKERWRIVPDSENSGMSAAGIIHTTRQSDGTDQYHLTRSRFSASICHQCMAISHRPPYNDQSSFSSCLSPWDDGCLYNGFSPDMNNDFPDDHIQQRCLIAAMGFLLSCKQGYFEACRVLYERNLFHISGDLMFRRLPYILPRQRLESITMVELVWDLYLRRMESVYCEKHRRMCQVTTFEDRLKGLGVMMDKLARRMPGMRKMWLCLQSNILPFHLEEQEERLEVIEKVLTMIYRGLSGLPRLENARVAFQTAS